MCSQTLITYGYARKLYFRQLDFVPSSKQTLFLRVFSEPHDCINTLSGHAKIRLSPSSGPEARFTCSARACAPAGCANQRIQNNSDASD
jgi:hypothetical protein